MMNCEKFLKKQEFKLMNNFFHNVKFTPSGDKS